MITYDTGGNNTSAWTCWATSSGNITMDNASATIWVTWNSGEVIDITYQPTPLESRVPIEWTGAGVRDAVEKQREAEHKANKLLLSLLNQRQRKEYRETEQITIHQNRKPKWKLFKRPSYNVLELDDCGQPLTEHCVQTRDTPLADQLATQYLYLHANPAELLKVANHRPA